MPTHWVGGEEGGFKKCERWASCSVTPNICGKLSLPGKSGTLVSLLTSAASCPLASLPGRRSHAPHKVFPKTAEFGGCSPSPMWEMQHRARGFQITDRYPSVVYSMFRHFASCFRLSLPVQCLVGASATKALQWGLGSVLRGGGGGESLNQGRWAKGLQRKLNNESGTAPGQSVLEMQPLSASVPFKSKPAMHRRGYYVTPVILWAQMCIHGQGG